MFNTVHLVSAAISTVPRLVGGSYRVGDAFVPQLRQKGATPEPALVIRRELASVSLTGLFSLLAAPGLEKLGARRGWGRHRVMLITTLLGNLLSEAAARFIAYRHLFQWPSVPQPANTGAALAVGRAMAYGARSPVPHRVWPALQTGWG